MDTGDMVGIMLRTGAKASEILGWSNGEWDEDLPPVEEWDEVGIDYMGLREAMWDRMVADGKCLGLWKYMTELGILGPVQTAIANDRPMSVPMLMRVCEKVGCPVDRAMRYRKVT